MSILKILEKHCEVSNVQKTGLLLLDLPTGIGKTYEALKYIYENYKKSNRKIIFLTNLKKNLKYDEDFKDFFVKDGCLSDFEKDIVFINSNVDSVIENLLDKDIKIPDFIKGSREFKVLKLSIQNYASLGKYKNNPACLDSQKKIKEEIRKTYEPEFRKYLTKLFYEKGEKKADRIELLKTNADYQWVQKVYPSSLSSEKKVFFLSIDKFLARNTPIIDKSHSFYDDKFLKNALIFIDEFDASKDILLKNIIESKLDKRIDIIALFEQIYSSFNALEIPAVFSKNSQSWEKQKKTNKKYQDISQIINKLKKEVKALNKKYNLRFSVKTLNQDKQRSFLFYDHQYFTVVGDQKSFIYLENNKTEGVNNILFVEPDKSRKDKPTVTELLSAIKGFIDYFSLGAKIIAENYENLKKEDPDVENFTFENALNSFLDELKLTEKQKEYFFASVQAKRSKKKGAATQLQDLNDLSFYNKGFCYYEFIDSEMHDTKSKINIVDFDTTPEKILLNWANTNLIVGISATAKMKTVIGNYDIRYLRRKLRDNYIEIDSSDFQDLKNEFELRNKNYVPVKTKFIEVDDWKKTIHNFNFASPTYNTLYTELENILVENGSSENQIFLIRRYLRIAQAYKEFIMNDNIQSFLCFLNTHPAENKSSCDLRILKMLFTAIVEKYKKEGLFKNTSGKFDINQSFRILNSTDFDEKKEELFKVLYDGKKLFLITTYKTLGAGQNIQYGLKDFNEGLKTAEIIQTYKPNYTTKDEKDFDAIYLDKPTNLLVNINGDKELEDSDANKRMFQVEMLYEANQIFNEEKNNEIRRTFQKRHYGKKYRRGVNIFSTEDFRNFLAKEIIQAIGRINRTYFKNKEVYVFADKEIAPHIKYFDKSNYLCLKEFEALIELAQYEDAVETPKDNRMKEIELHNIRCHNWINAKIKAPFWDKEKIEDWQFLREMVLKKPTISKKEFEDLNEWQFIYIPMLDSDLVTEKARNAYSYKLPESKTEGVPNDFNNVEIDFLGNGQEVSEEAVNLPGLMKNPEIRGFFTSKGYAPEFLENDYMIAPEIFNNIYKGAMGEVIGKFIWEKFVTPNKKLKELNPKIYEKFDFMIKPGVFIDFKFWNDLYGADAKEQIAKIFNLKVHFIREKKMKFSQLFVVNIVADEKYDILKRKDNQLIEVPRLISENNFEIDFNLISELQTIILSTTNNGI